MPKVDLYNMGGQVVGDVNLSEEIFGTQINKEVMHMSVVNHLANCRQGTQSTKTKSEVRGGGRKPWRQKGTGRARQGSIRSAQWIKGGIIHGPTPRSFRYTLPKKVKRLALKSALSAKVVDNSILVLNELTLDAIKTKKMVEVLGNLKVNESVLLVTADADTNVQRSARNIPGVKAVSVNTINTYDILKYSKFIITKDAVEKVEEVYA